MLQSSGNVNRDEVLPELNSVQSFSKMVKQDALALFNSLRSAYSATPTTLKVIDLYVGFAVSTAIIQVVYMALVGSFPFNSFLSGVLSCIGTAVLAVCLCIQVNKENKEFEDLAPDGPLQILFSAIWCCIW